MDASQSQGRFSLAELQNAFRNRGMPLEGLRYDVTPTGLHYLLVHFDIPDVDADTWRLTIGGHVDRPLDLSLQGLLARPARTLRVTMECAGNGRARMVPRAESQPWLFEAIGTAEWTGTPLGGVLEEAGVRDGAVEFVFTGADHGLQGGVEHDYQRSLTVAEATRDDVLLAYAMNGRPLEPQHGAPVRLLVPGWYGMTSVKWLTRVEAVTTPFRGYQQADAYRYQTDADDPGQPVTRIRVRALMVPPGFPDFPERLRYVAAGALTVRGRAWSGQAPIARVELGFDGEWTDATLGPDRGDYAWRAWSAEIDVTPGEHLLGCRATDAAGHTQPNEVWNMQGMGNNAIQQVPILAQ
jgi:DMSO/TMAO reductase YedYZ molybdopterin-dependent catalytic subunit